METLALTVHITDGLREELVAELAEIGFEAFLEEDDHLKAYGPIGLWLEVEAKLMGWLRARHVGAAINIEVLPAENWNAKWEATIQPLVVGSFVIAPTWAEPRPEHASLTLLQIDPKMSFGTGHHESTRLALRLLEQTIRTGNRVLDAGTGTGVLAIAAVKLGAASALGFDIDPTSVGNAIENARLNHVHPAFEVRQGTLDTVGEIDFDVVVVNMIRMRLEPLLPALALKLSTSGSIILSGLLQTEGPAMTDLLHSLGLQVVEEATENDWWGCVASSVSDVPV